MIAPYKRPPTPPTVALLLPGPVVITEKGSKISLDDVPESVRIWGSYDVVRTLVTEGHGEALCWNGEEIRWRHKRWEDGWKNRHSDVSVIKLPLPSDTMKALRGLANWRDWLESYRAAPISTMGAAAWSLLRASVRRPLYISSGQIPPLRQALGGRQQLGPKGAGSFSGSIEQLDIPAAYAHELGTVFYGGRWFQDSEFPGGPHGPEWWSQYGRPTFVRCVIEIPHDLPFGPLPRRPKARQSELGSLLLSAEYPVGMKMRGLWTWEEVQAAVAAGCKLLRVVETWGHMAASEQPFLRWWVRIQEGREMRGLAGQLAKMTGNALWGRFCMDGKSGVRTIRRQVEGEKHARSRAVPFLGGGRPDFALAETVSGRIRARLFQFMLEAGDSLLTAHTDGAWTYTLPQEPDGWRRKMKASRLDLLDPQVLRYWPARSHDPVAVFSGVPGERALDSFSEAWSGAGYGENP